MSTECINNLSIDSKTLISEFNIEYRQHKENMYLVHDELLYNASYVLCDYDVCEKKNIKIRICCKNVFKSGILLL